MLFRDSSFCIVDLETTGFGDEKGPGKDRVVEFAAVWFTLGQPLTWTSTLINPERAIPYQAMATHHITDEMVQDAQLFGPYLDKFEWKSDYQVAHKASFEQKFIKFPGQVLCTHRMARVMWPDNTYSNNQYLRYFLGLKKIPELDQLSPEEAHAHRALFDAIVTAKNLEVMMGLILQNRPDITVEEVIAWINKPILLKYLEFGKYRGIEYGSVDSGYLEWLERSFKNPDPGKERDLDVEYTVNWWLHEQPF